MFVTTVLLATVLTTLGDLAEAFENGDSTRHASFCVTGAVECTVPFQEKFLHLAIGDEKTALDITGTLHGECPVPGDVVEVTGKMMTDRPGHAIPCFRTLRRIGHVPPREPVVGDVDAVMSEKRTFRRSTLVGELRDVVPSATNPCWLYLYLATQSGPGIVNIPKRGARLADVEHLIGATLGFTGFPSSYNSTGRFSSDRVFMCAGTNDVTVVSPVPADPFAAAPPVEVLRRIPPEKYSQYGRHRAKGHILAVWQHRHAILELKNANIIQVDFNEPVSFLRGAPVEVVGYPMGDAFHLRLTRAIARTTALPSRIEPPPVPFTASNIDRQLSESFLVKNSIQGMLYRIEGRVLALTQEHRRLQIFPLEVGGHIISADYSCAPRLGNDLSEGCQVKMTATCVLETESWATGAISMKLNGINFVLNRPEDFEILSYPPWWTPARLTALILALLVMLALVLIWNHALRVLSEKRGRELYREKSEGAEAALRAEERTRLAVEIHDSLSQILTGAAMQLDAGDIGLAKRILASCRRELRCCIGDLRSNALDESNLADAVRLTVAPHLGERTIDVDFDIPSDALSEPLRHATLRIIRELVVNAVRHGRATHLMINGSCEVDESNVHLTFSVADNGRGFDPETVRGSQDGHFGLLGIRERAKAFNGSIEIDSTPGNGTVISVTLEDENPKAETK